MPSTELDLLVLGSGVAGLSAAVRAADTHKMRVGVLTKGELPQATTRWAQGGVAAVLHGDPDSTDLHLADTLKAGAGLCVGVLTGTVVTVLATALINVISEVTGGIRLVVIEEDVQI